MNYESYFVSLKQRVIQDLGDYFCATRLDELTLALSQSRRSRSQTNDQYRSRQAKVPAFYNPNTHTIHLNISALEAADGSLVENIYYHELVHAASHHARIFNDNHKSLKSGIKIQVWDQNDNQTTHYRHLNEGITQYFANSFTSGGNAYKNEVAIIGRLVQRIGLHELRAAYFGPEIERL